MIQSGCSDNDPVPGKPNPCPLPYDFNHNALLHIMMMMDCLVYFAAEFVHLRRCRQRGGGGHHQEAEELRCQSALSSNSEIVPV